MWDNDPSDGCGKKNGPIGAGFLMNAKMLAICLALASLAITTPAVAKSQERNARTLLEGPSITAEGLWTVHRAGNRVLFEFPASSLGSDIVVQLARSSGGPVTHQILRWERQVDRIMLYTIERSPLDLYSGDSSPGQRVADARLVEGFPIIGQGRFGAPIIDASSLFACDLPNWLKGSDLPTSRKDKLILSPITSSITSVKSFPKNVVVTATQLAIKNGQLISSHARWNFVALPKRPMMPRLWDRRFGQMSSGWMAGETDSQSGDTKLMLRWRLEKKYPDQKLSDPVEPIVIYIDPKTPEKWRSYVRRGIEAWKPAFEAAGFSNAIQAKATPDDWSPDDIRYTTMLWNDRDSGREQDSHRLMDPRTGEILQFNLGAMPTSARKLSMGYFVAITALDPRARQYPLPDQVMGDLHAMVVSHELGHILGLADGNYGKYAYSVEDVRSREWLMRMGFTPSIMNYTRVNYVAQPEDNIPPPLLLQQIGPADHYQIRAGYEPVPGADTVGKDRMALDALASLQNSEPMYRFNTAQSVVFNGVGSFSGPDTVLEVVETTDPVQSAKLGLNNLRLALEALPTATLQSEDGAADYAALYTTARLHWMNMMHHVVSMVGGYTRFRRAGHEPRGEGTPVPAAAQRDAMRFLAREAFKPPRYLAEKAVTELLPSDLWSAGESEISRVMDASINILDALLEPNRLRRLAEAEHGMGMYGGTANRYGLREMLADLRGAIWSELADPSVGIDPCRQSLQEAYVELLKKRLTEQPERPNPSSSIKRPIETFIENAIRAELSTLRGSLESALANVHDPIMGEHIRRMQKISL